MIRFLLILIVCIASVSVSAQVDTARILSDIHEKIEATAFLSGKVTLKEKLFYNEDTVVHRGSFVVDYSDTSRSGLFRLSVYENSYHRFLLYDTTGIEYVVPDKGKAGVVKTISAESLKEGGLKEPLFPFILDKAAGFKEWFFADYSRISIRSLNDTIIVLHYKGSDTVGLKEPPVLTIALYRKSLLPKTIESRFVLSNGESQYQYYSFSYGLTGKELQRHQKAYSSIRSGKHTLTDKNTTSGPPAMFQQEGDRFLPLQLISANNKAVTISALSDQYLLLDFTYIACKPCIESIPTLNKLDSQFRNELKIVSVNPFDPWSRIVAHKQKMQIRYDTYLVAGSVFKGLHINRFPLFVLVGKDGVIKYAGAGYSESLFDEIAARLNGRP